MATSDPRSAARSTAPTEAPIQVRATALSLLVLGGALAMLWLGHWLPSQTPDKIEIREIAVTLPPPPPPPPPVEQQQVVETNVSVQIQGTGAALPKIDIEKKLTPIKPDLPTIDTSKTQWQDLDIDWDAFDLNQLDDLPKLLSSLRVTFPKSLSRRGIKKVLVKLDVVINDQGQVTLVNIIENPHPELNHAINRLVRSSRFSAPQKDGQPVRARFIWPVEIEA